MLADNGWCGSSKSTGTKDNSAFTNLYEFLIYIDARHWIARLPAIYLATIVFESLSWPKCHQVSIYQVVKDGIFVKIGSDFEDITIENEIYKTNLKVEIRTNHVMF